MSFWARLGLEPLGYEMANRAMLALSRGSRFGEACGALNEVSGPGLQFSGEKKGFKTIVFYRVGQQ